MKQSFQTIPVELQQEIMGDISDVKDLKSFVFASKSVYSCFEGSHETILEKVLRNTLSEVGLHRACAIALLENATFDINKNECFQQADQYRYLGKTPVLIRITKSLAAVIIANHRAIDSLAEKLHHDVCEIAHPMDIITDSKLGIQTVLPMSKDEEQRIFRALYAVWFFHLFFGTDISPFPEFKDCVMGRLPANARQFKASRKSTFETTKHIASSIELQYQASPQGIVHDRTSKNGQGQSEFIEKLDLWERQEVLTIFKYITMSLLEAGAGCHSRKEAVDSYRNDKPFMPYMMVVKNYEVGHCPITSPLLFADFRSTVHYLVDLNPSQQSVVNKVLRGDDPQSIMSGYCCVFDEQRYKSNSFKSRFDDYTRAQLLKDDIQTYSPKPICVIGELKSKIVNNAIYIHDDTQIAYCGFAAGRMRLKALYDPSSADGRRWLSNLGVFPSFCIWDEWRLNDWGFSFDDECMDDNIAMSRCKNVYY